MDSDYQGSSLSQETFVPSCFISVGIFWISAQNFFSMVMIYLRKDPPLPNLDLQPASTTELVMHLQSAWNAPGVRLQSTLSSPGVSKQHIFYCLVNCFSILVSLPRSATVILGHCCFSYPSRIFEWCSFGIRFSNWTKVCGSQSRACDRLTLAVESNSSPFVKNQNID